jgi:tetratricopeptide (TPR) repeat protein
MGANSKEEAPSSPLGAHGEVLQMLQKGDVEQAAAVFDRALQRWPANSQLLLLKGDVLAHTSEPQSAVLHYATLLKNPKLAPWGAGRLLKLLREKRTPLADALELGRQICEAEVETKLKEVLLDSLLERQNPDERSRLIEIAARAGILRFELKLAIARLEGGDFEAALEILEAARRAGRTSAPASTLLADLLQLFSRPTEAIAVLDELLEQFPDHPDIYRRLTHALQRICDFTRAADIFERAVKRWPHDWMLMVRLNRLQIERRSLERIFDIVSEDADAAAARNERFRFHFARACLLVGQVDRGLRLLAAPFEPAVATLASPLQKALAARTPEHWVGGSRLFDDRTSDVQVTRARNARATVILTINVSFGNLPHAFVDTLFADHGVNVIYLRDFRMRAYLRGVVGLGRDEAATIAALKKLVAELGAARTICMGSSSGGFAAFRYAYLMGADAAVSFAGPSNASPDVVYRKKRVAAWNPDIFDKALLDREKDLPLDLLPLLSEPSRTNFIQVFGQENVDDVPLAHRLEGLPGVTLRPLPGVSSHYVLDHMIGDGSFDELLETLVAG